MKNFRVRFILIILLSSSFLAPLTFAAEKDLYDFLWLDPDKAVYVLQNKVYKKKAKFYFNISYISGISSEFQSTTGFNISLGYYLGEEWSFEVAYNQYQNSNNVAYDNLLTVLKLVPFIRRVKTSYGGMLVWAPFYGKINTFNKIFYFDWSFGAGYQLLNGESNAENVGQKNVRVIYDNETYHSLVGKTSFRFHVTKNAHIEISYQKNVFQALGPTSSDGVKGENLYRFNTDVLFSVGMTL